MEGPPGERQGRTPDHPLHGAPGPRRSVNVVALHDELDIDRIVVVPLGAPPRDGLFFGQRLKPQRPTDGLSQVTNALSGADGGWAGDQMSCAGMASVEKSSHRD